MIIECSECGRHYNINRNVLGEPNFEKDSRKGWEVKCQGCGKNWFLPAVLLEQFLQLSNKKNQNKNSKKSPDLFVNKKNVDDYAPKDPEKTFSNIQESSTVSSSHETENVVKNPKYFRVPQYKYVIIFLCVFFSIVSFFIFRKFIDDYSCNLSSLSEARPLIKNVHSSIQKKQNDKQTILVTGEFLNNYREVLHLPVLQINAYGPCSKTDIKNDQRNLNTKPYCLKISWNHQFAKNIILPGEQIAFHSAHSVPSSFVIARVEVTIP
jgi:hypothetical protein